MSERLTNMDSRRISPNGVVTLPFVARLALGFEKGKPQMLAAEVTRDSVVLTTGAEGSGAVKASPKGLVMLPADAREVLGGGKSRYALDVDEKARRVVLRRAAR